jgi:hypothetical protein
MPLRFEEDYAKEFELNIPTPEGVVPCNLRYIKSSNIEWVAWPQVETTPPLMFVEFKGGGRYIYVGVSRQRAVACAYAESTGSYFAKYIKNGYQTIKLR